MLRYKRKHKHGLKGWGEAISNSKIEYDDWSQFSPEMMKYCVQDVMLNADVYFKLSEVVVSLGPMVTHSKPIFFF